MNDPTRISDPDGKFNKQHTLELIKLFAVPPEKRDRAWLDNVHKYALNASLVSAEPQIIQGPDGFPYFQLHIPAEGPITPFCVSHIIDYCVENGYGAVIFGADKQRPEFVITFGQMGCLKGFNKWIFEDFTGTREVKEDTEVLTGVPSEEYFPNFMRPVLASFMREALRVETPKIGLVMMPNGERSLVVNIKPSQLKSEEHARSLAGALQWFLMPGQGIMFLPENMDDEWMGAI
jgi:hypothetical protein